MGRAVPLVGYTHEAAVLKCVKCGHPVLDRDGDGWKCAACGAIFPLVGGVGRFVASEHYTGSFGFQWNTFSKAQLDSANGTSRSRDTFVEKTGLTLESLRGRRVLDAGCGMGRFAEVCIEAGAEVHAIDLSTAVEAAARNLGIYPNASFYQADIMNLPFADGTFDVIYSIGVLHHTPDTRKAFLSLTRLVKPGGLIVIWVYSTMLRRMFGGEVLRLVTPRLPKPLLLKAPRRSRCRSTTCTGCRWSARPAIALLPTSLNPTPMAVAGYVRLVFATLPVEALLPRSGGLVPGGRFDRYRSGALSRFVVSRRTACPWLDSARRIRRAKILFLIGRLDVGGTETQLVELVSRLDRQLFELLVCSIGRRSPRDRPARPRHCRSPAWVPRLPVSRPTSGRCGRRAAAGRALQAIRRERPDILHGMLILGLRARARSWAGGRACRIVVASRRSLGLFKENKPHISVLEGWRTG